MDFNILNNYRPDISQLMNRSSNPFCAVDPMLSWVVKEFLDVLISPITSIVNKSLSLGVFPRSMKAAIGKSLIKKPHHGL